MLCIYHWFSWKISHCVHQHDIVLLCGSHDSRLYMLERYLAFPTHTHNLADLHLDREILTRAYGSNPHLGKRPMLFPWNNDNVIWIENDLCTRQVKDRTGSCCTALLYIYTAQKRVRLWLDSWRSSISRGALKIGRKEFVRVHDSMFEPGQHPIVQLMALQVHGFAVFQN